MTEYLLEIYKRVLFTDDLRTIIVWIEKGFANGRSGTDLLAGDTGYLGGF